MTFTGCVTSSFSELENNSFFAEDGNLGGTLFVNNRKSVILEVKNKTSDVASLIVDLASFTDNGSGFSSRLVEENTKLLSKINK